MAVETSWAKVEAKLLEETGIVMSLTPAHTAGPSTQTVFKQKKLPSTFLPMCSEAESRTI